MTRPRAARATADQAAVVEALNTLGKAMNQAVSSVGNAVKDPEVRDGLTERSTRWARR